MGDWTWLSYVAFSMYLGKGYWISRQRPTPAALLSPIFRDEAEPFATLLPLLHEEAERLLGDDYMAKDLGDGVVIGWMSLTGEANLRRAQMRYHPPE